MLCRSGGRDPLRRVAGPPQEDPGGVPGRERGTDILSEWKVVEVKEWVKWKTRLVMEREEGRGQRGVLRTRDRATGSAEAGSALAPPSPPLLTTTARSAAVRCRSLCVLPWPLGNVTACHL